MKALERHVVLITDTGADIGCQVALAIASEGGRVVVNDKTYAGSIQSAADRLANTIQRRSGEGATPVFNRLALPAYGGCTDLRECMQMLRVAPDWWGEINAIVHVGPDATGLQVLLSAAPAVLSEWGGRIITVNADKDTMEVAAQNMDSLFEQHIMLDVVDAGESDVSSTVCELLTGAGGHSALVAYDEPDYELELVAK